MTGVDRRTDLAAEVFAVVGRFRRQLRRSTRTGFGIAGLTQAQVELLRLVGRQPGIAVREAADELALAANTASTLVSKLVADGYLLRTADAADRRIGRLRLTGPAQEVADASRTARRAALAAVLDRLGADDRADLARGLTVLSRMTDLLQEDVR